MQQFISRLPYLTEPGHIHAAFMEKEVEGRMIAFVIHRVPIRSATGMGYASDYYSVFAFSRAGDNFSLDRRLSDYFGQGADVLDLDDESNDDRFVYLFPYKTKESIVRKLRSDEYRSWMDKKNQNFTVINKASIYSERSTGSATKMYLVPGDRVKVEVIEAGWISMSYLARKGIEINGWLMCSDVVGC